MDVSHPVTLTHSESARGKSQPLLLQLFICLVKCKYQAKYVGTTHLSCDPPLLRINKLTSVVLISRLRQARLPSYCLEIVKMRGEM